jgi:Tol biopolymer transport system component
MRFHNLIFIVLICSLVLVSSGFVQQSAKQLFQSALYEEEVSGDLEKAISLYNKVLEVSKDDTLAAKAQLQIGVCYEKLGKTEAIKAYELVVERFAGQKEQVAAARARLAELRREPPKGLSVVKLDLSEPEGMSIQPVEIFPDGKKMVGVDVSKGQNIVVCDLETKQVRFLTNHVWDKNGRITYNPVLSPGGNEIAYSELGMDGGSLRLATLDGISRILANDPEGWFVPTSWLPDGRAVLTIKGGGPDEAHQLGLVSIKGGDFKTLVTLQGKNQVVAREYATASVSPDGQYILFTDTQPGKQSDIYVMGIEGGAPKPLIEHPAAEKYPRWSPDGKHAAFLSMRHGSWALWGIAVEKGQAVGEPFLIQDGMSSSLLLNWTTNGLASWSTTQIFDIFLLDVDPVTGEPAGKPRQLEFAPTGVNVSPVWAPDGKSLAFYKRSDDDHGSVVLVSETSTYEVPLPAGHFSRFGNLKWTPDGGGIGMLSTDEGSNLIDSRRKFLLRLDFESRKWETKRLPVERGWHFEWGGSGKAVYLSQGGDPKDEGTGIFELDLDTGAKRYVYRPKPESTVFMIRSLKRSRDNRQLAFIENSTDYMNIMVVNLETGESHAAATEFGGFNSWSPDGRKLLADGMFGVAIGKEKSRQSLFIIAAEGGAINEIDLGKSLPPKSEINAPDWSPDGKKVAFYLNSWQGGVFLHRNVIPANK